MRHLKEDLVVRNIVAISYYDKVFALTEFACEDEGARVEGVDDGHVVVLRPEEGQQVLIGQELSALVGQVVHELEEITKAIAKRGTPGLEWGKGNEWS